jgi:hypothetical protein
MCCQNMHVGSVLTARLEDSEKSAVLPDVLPDRQNRFVFSKFANGRSVPGQVAAAVCTCSAGHTLHDLLAASLSPAWLRQPQAGHVLVNLAGNIILPGWLVLRRQVVPTAAA